MKDKNKYHGQRDYIPGWNLDALRIERHKEYSSDRTEMFINIFDYNLIMFRGVSRPIESAAPRHKNKF